MAGSINKVILVGNLGADPEVRRTQDGRPIVNLRIATSDSWRDRQSGERREKTEWHRVVIFNEALAKTAEQYLRKGSKVYLEGALQTREWEDQQGQKRFSTEVVLQNFNASMVLLDSRAGGAAGGEDPGEADYGQSRGGGSGGGAARGGFDRPASGGAQRGGYSGGSGSGGRPAPAAAADMDDEIPF